MVYRGSKRKVAKKILEQIPAADYFIEPFVGGGNLTQFIDKCKYGEIRCYDINKYVIAYFNALKDGWLPEEYYSYEFYLELRNDMEKYPPQIYAHLGFNTTYISKFMASTTLLKLDAQKASRRAFNNAVKDSKWVQGITFEHASYDEIKIPSSSVIYCDPPYINTGGYRLVEKFDHTKFYSWAEKQKKCFVSYTEMPKNWHPLICHEIKHRLSGKNYNKKYKISDCLWILKE